MTKEMIFDEFKIVQKKDARKKKNDYAHTIAYLQGHVDAKKQHPNQYRNLDIKFFVNHFFGHHNVYPPLVNIYLLILS